VLAGVDAQSTYCYLLQGIEHRDGDTWSLLREIAEDLLPVRPNRHEPRVVNRRPKSFPRMRQSRDLLKAKLAF
jgi:hypothetical protein